MMLPRPLAAALALLLAACGSEVDTDELPPISDYPEWDQFEVTGEVAGHGDSFRLMYVNDVAQTWVGAGPYPPGSIVVKEIYELGDDGGPGELAYLAIARKLEVAPGGGELLGGWLWTTADDRASAGVEELYFERCWDSCHAAAPADGLFHDFGL